MAASMGFWCVGIAFSLFATSASSQDAASCRSIQDGAARLSCYDSVFPQNEKKAVNAADLKVLQEMIEYRRDNISNNPVTKDAFAERRILLDDCELFIVYIDFSANPYHLVYGYKAYRVPLGSISGFGLYNDDVIFEIQRGLSITSVSFDELQYVAPQVVGDRFKTGSQGQNFSASELRRADLPSFLNTVADNKEANEIFSRFFEACS